MCVCVYTYMTVSALAQYCALINIRRPPANAQSRPSKVTGSPCYAASRLGRAHQDEIKNKTKAQQGATRRNNSRHFISLLHFIHGSGASALHGGRDSERGQGRCWSSPCSGRPTNFDAADAGRDTASGLPSWAGGVTPSCTFASNK